MSSIADRQDAQLSSPFFSKLPLEIRRLIYVEAWRTAGLALHVFPGAGGLGHAPCLLDDPFQDELLESLNQLWQTGAHHGPAGGLNSPEWSQHLMSAMRWANHWRCCEHAYPAGTVGAPRRKQPVDDGRSPFLPLLLTCRRMHLEAADSLGVSVSFVLTDLITARRLLKRSSPLAVRPRRVSMALRYDPGFVNASMRRVEEPVGSGKHVWTREPRASELWRETIDLALDGGGSHDRRVSLWLWAPALTARDRQSRDGLREYSELLFSHLGPEEAGRLRVSLPGRSGSGDVRPGEGDGARKGPEICWREGPQYESLNGRIVRR